MNITFLNSEDAIGFMIVGVSSLFLHSYALFLCSAIIDYQDEKPENERSSFDVLIKDFLRSAFCLTYFWKLVQFISLFTPSYVTCVHNFFYWVN